MTGLFDLSGRRALVTGGGGGLGTASCLALARAGASVAVVGRSRDKCEATASLVTEAGGVAAVATADVTDEASVADLVSWAAGEFGPIDILVNNAGVTSPKPLAELTVVEWDSIMDVSAKGAFLCTRAFAPGMIAQGRGRIVNLGSILSERGIANRSAYSAAKAAIANFTRASAVELGLHGITVNALGPTVIVTDLNRELVRAQPQLYRAIVDRTPMGRLGEIPDLEGPLVFLASDASAFVTGQILYVDGGYTAS
jgi:2-deoxy-D-gluconate 3-dehydrogenase